MFEPYPRYHTSSKRSGGCGCWNQERRLWLLLLLLLRLVEPLELTELLSEPAAAAAVAIGVAAQRIILLYCLL